MISPITSFYTFITTFPYLTSSSIYSPPPCGWSASDTEVFRKLGKSDAVIEVLSHLSYIIYRHGEEWVIAWETIPIYYIGERITARLENTVGVDQDFMQRNGLHPYGQVLSEDVVALTNGSTYGFWLLLDVKEGTITEYSSLGGESEKINSEKDGKTDWRDFPMKSVKDFFDAWKAKYSFLDWIPIQDKNGNASGEIWNEEFFGQDKPKEIRKIYLDHGWGTANFNKEKCRSALRDWKNGYNNSLLDKIRERIAAQRALEPDLDSSD